MRARSFVVLVLLAAAGCSDANNQTYAQAAAATSLEIVAVGINRLVTNDCWGRCSPGYLCNEESGLCELGECVPGCESGMHCAQEVRGNYRCVPDSAPWLNPLAPTTASVTPTPVPATLTR